MDPQGTAKGLVRTLMSRSLLTRRLVCIALAPVAGAFPTLTTAQSNAAGFEDAPAEATRPSEDATSRPVIIRSKPWLFNRETRYAHSPPEVNGEIITVTKKVSVEKLADQPTIIDNNQREVFARLPGVLVSEQQNPDQLNLSYRGIGNPQESEYVLVLQDGIPLMSDWIGFPTLYTIPAPQSLAEVQLIRGGAGLLYGPEPQPVINFVSRRPDPNRVLAGYSEHVGGSDGLYSTYEQLSGTSGNWNYLGSFQHRESDGRRANGGYGIDGGDLHLGYRFDGQHTLSFDFHAYATTSGDAGRMSYTQWQAKPDLTTTPDNHTWLDRYTGVITYEGGIGARGSVTAKLWSGYQDLDQRTSPNIVPPALPASSLLSIERYHYTGIDTRYRASWSRANALTVGFTAYRSTAPWLRYSYSSPANLLVDRHDPSGTLNLNQDRETRYGAAFAENVFRFARIHVVPSVRYEHEELAIDEHLVPVPRPLIDRTYRRSLPLFGLGFGNDFGLGNETYVNISQGFRPLRYLDVASPFGHTNTALNDPDPTKSLSYEAGVHGWPLKGLYYDVSVFQVDVRNRIETRAAATATDPTATINVNTGNTRSRGVEGELHVDLLRFVGSAPGNEHLELYGNASILWATFTASSMGLTGNTPAFAPRYLVRTGASWRTDDRFKVSLNLESVASSYFQDSNRPVGVPGAANYLPARTPAHTVLDLAGDYTVLEHLRLLGGVANLTDRMYYARVFQNTLEPASRRTWYAGLSLEL